ncbi:hypothetical protein Sjap_026606 [Stephania japonica]|uniref:Uncharacterized protein n=1 Tax=Stephania japonica TaxID=461633 RepID=A0AAP0E256_9MAGN
MNLESGWLTAPPPFPGGSPAGEGLAIVTLSPGVWGRKISTHSVPAVRRDPQQTKGESLLAVALFDFSRLGLVSVSYLSRLASNLSRLAASLSRRVRALASSVSVEGKKTNMVILGTWLVHSLAHELAASPEATSRLLSSAERCLARSDSGGAGEGRRGSAFLHARARQNASLARDEAKPRHTIGEGSTPPFIAPGERKFYRGFERRGGRKGSGWI